MSITSKIKNVVWFNHWHYGDFFSTRGVVADIKRQLSNFKYSYAHSKHPDATKDLIDFKLPKEMNDRILNSINQRQRCVVSDDTLFINTWVGAYEGVWNQSVHPPYVDHYLVFKEMYNTLNSLYKFDLKLDEDVWRYIPEISYSAYDTDSTLKFSQQGKGKFFLFCNNEVKSAQSSMGNMAEIINTLAAKYPNDTFIVTQPIDISQSNVYFTNDIFNKENDLGEISYLSTHCDVIIGKNSSPFTYTNTGNMLKNPKKTFVCFSHKLEDTLPHRLDIKAKFLFSDSTDNAYCVDFLDKIFANE